jgi:hypothetical protein
MSRYANVTLSWRAACTERDRQRNEVCARFFAGSMWITIATIAVLRFLR